MESPFDFRTPRVQLTRAEIRTLSPKGHGQRKQNGWMLADWKAFGGFFNVKRRGVFCYEVRPCCFEPLKDIKRRTTRPERRVLQRNRRAKHGHDAAAGKAANEAALLTHCLVHKLRQTSRERV
jgi:hypothetical protein